MRPGDWKNLCLHIFTIFHISHIIFVLRSIKMNHINVSFKSAALKLLFCLFSYQGVLTLIRAKAEDSGNYSIRAETSNQTASNSFYLQVKGGTFSFFQYLQVVFVTPLFTYICICCFSPLLRVCLSLCTSLSFLTTLCIHLLGFSCCQLEDLCQAMCSYMCLQYKCWFSYVLYLS